QGNHVHGRLDGHADGRLGDAVAFDDLALALRGAAAVAAHGRDQERLGAELLEEVGDAAAHHRDVGAAAAAGGQRDGWAGFDGAGQVEPLQGGADGGGDVIDGRPLGVTPQGDEGG